MATLTIALLAAATPALGGEARCTGDCDDDKSVDVSELITISNIALGRRDLLDCKNGDPNDDGSIQIDELIRAVDHLLDGCEGDIEPKPFKTRIDHPFDPYLAFSATEGGPSWVKLTIRVEEPQVVYFQNSAQTPFHHDFVAASLEPYIGWTPAEIDAVSLHAAGQELVFGAVLYSPTFPSEIAIQLVRQDAYSVGDVVTYFEAVRASINVATGVPFFYFPTFEQQESAHENSQALEASGIPLGSEARWTEGDVCYAFGWAHGRVVFVPGEDIEDAYEAGTLGPEDILLTDGVPAQIPFVAGVLSLAPSTPNSHVAILAADWEIPFVFLSRSESVEAAQALVGRDVVLRATTLSPRIFTGTDVDFEKCQVRLVDVTDSLGEEVMSHLRDLKRAPDLQLRPFVSSGTYFAEVFDATPDDIVSIGGKAANYGFLRRAIPDHSRAAMAVTFDLWNDYLDQEVDGVVLRERIASLLAPFPTYPPADFGALFDALDDVRDLIDDEADFTPAQRTAIVEALQRFDPLRQIRFRSSTNVEDSDVFTGAGLYDSESGCLADDVDEDELDLSYCDATRDEERGVFRALRKVFQSFYNDNAFLERLRHGVDETTVGMAVLVHYSFPDETELANGVATLRTTGPFSTAVTIVIQPGAFSVTNPEDGGLPEIVEVFVFSGSSFPTVRQGSDHLPLGATVLQLPGEYMELTNLLVDVGEAFGEFHGETQFDIEFEFKKTAAEGLVITQVRRIPGISEGTETPPVLIHVPTSLCTFQGEYADVFANYRLKSRWQPVFSSGPIDEASTFLSAADHRYVLDGGVLELSGAPSSWPEARHETFDPQAGGVLGFADSWSIGSGGSRRVMTLKTMVPTNIGPGRIPIVFPEDLGFTLEAELDTPAPYLDFDGTADLRSTESVWLTPCTDLRPLTDRHLLQQRSFDEGAVEIATDFYWPAPPTGAVAGYTAPVDRWVATTISGIVSQPVALQGYFSQTYRPEHHNFSENFIFDPHLEEGFDTDLLEEWDAQGIQAVVKPAGFNGAAFKALTSDGRLVDLGDLLE
jgi:hypothetical protein